MEPLIHATKKDFLASKEIARHYMEDEGLSFDERKLGKMTIEIMKISIVKGWDYTPQYIHKVASFYFQMGFYQRFM